MNAHTLAVGKLGIVATKSSQAKGTVPSAAQRSVKSSEAEGTP